MLYLVTETKAEDWSTSLPHDGKEWQKIQCGARHFGSSQLDTSGALEDVDYCVAGSVAELQGMLSMGKEPDRVGLGSRVHSGSEHTAGGLS